MEAVYKFHADCGSMGVLTGVFVADTQAIEWLINSKAEVYLGEVLGKHSEIYGAIEEKDITLVSTDEAVVKTTRDNGLTNGFNPLQYPLTQQSAETLLGDDYEDDLMAIEVYNKLRPNN